MGITALHPVTERGLYKPDFTHEHLTLCLEPEVAAIYCQQITADQLLNIVIKFNLVLTPQHDIWSWILEEVP